MWKYYGVDWACFFSLFTGIYLVGSHKRYGFLLGMVGCIFGVIFGYLVNSIPLMIMDSLLSLNYLRGFLNWRE